MTEYFNFRSFFFLCTLKINWPQKEWSLNYLIITKRYIFLSLFLSKSTTGVLNCTHDKKAKKIVLSQKGKGNSYKKKNSNFFWNVLYLFVFIENGEGCYQISCKLVNEIHKFASNQQVISGVTNFLRVDRKWREGRSFPVLRDPPRIRDENFSDYPRYHTIGLIQFQSTW